MLKANEIYYLNGVKICEKIIPDGTVWKDAAKAKKANKSWTKGSHFKKGQKLNNKTGKPLYITVHNTKGHNGTNDEGELYTRATYNENMGSARVHFYVDANGAWQNLKAGTGMCANDPEGSAEVGWHAGDGSNASGGNYTSIALEVIMGKSDKKLNEKAYDNAARIIAWLCTKHGLPLSAIVSHTYWCNRIKGIKFTDADEQSTNLIKGQKWCPTYIFDSTTKSVALRNWRAFKEKIALYMDVTPEPIPEEYVPTVLEWQTAAFADGFKFPKAGLDGRWGSECKGIAKKAVCKRRLVHRYPNLTKLVQKVVGTEQDGKFGAKTEKAVKAWQSAHGLDADGHVGQKTWATILHQKL